MHGFTEKGEGRREEEGARTKRLARVEEGSGVGRGGEGNKPRRKAGRRREREEEERP